MISRFVRAARFVYRRTPFLPLRRLFYRAFAWVVRHRVVRREIDGAVYQLELGEILDLSLFLGEFEPEIRSAVARYCRPEMTVVDIGANFGAHTLLFADAVAPGGRVIAFEPTGYAYRKLETNVGLNPAASIRTVNVALTDAARPPERLYFRSSWPTFGPRRDGESLVSFDTLDGWCGRNGVARVDLIKLDVDGNELGVLQGARGIIRSSRPIIFIECSRYQSGASPVALLADEGYRIEHARTGRVYTHAAEVLDDLAGHDSMNLVCLPKEG